ncbi:MAG: SGNH/GDSL hydrolase family protein [Lachnospiraceae bacterium]|nr:SGNH/GDSL hydrolase family protein [Lachnospiraceae bacterium]
MLKILYTLSKEYQDKNIYLYGINRDSVNVFTDLAYRGINVSGFVDPSGRYVGSDFMNRPIVSGNTLFGNKDIIIIHSCKSKAEIQGEFPETKVFYSNEILDVDYELKDKRVLLYGIGERGEEVYQLLCQRGIAIEAVYVTEKKQDTWNGLEVHAIEELREDSKTAIIIAAKVNRYQEEMLGKIEKCRLVKYIDEFLPEFWSEQGDLFQVIHKACTEGKEIWLYGNDNEDSQLIENILGKYDISVCGKVYEEEIEEKGIKNIYELAYEDVKNIMVIIAERNRQKSQNVCEILDQMGFSMEDHNYTAIYSKASEFKNQMKILTDCLVGHVEIGNGRQQGYEVYGNNQETDLKILILGGSTSTDGHYRPLSWPYRFYKMLNNAGYSVTVYNGSACGYDIVQELLRLLRDGPYLKPDYIISMSGVNNIAQKGRTNNQFCVTTFIDWINALAPGKEYESGVHSEEPLYDFWYRNTKIMKMISEFYGAKFYSFLQPSNIAKPATTLFETTMHEKRDMLENTRIYREKAQNEMSDIFINLIDRFDAEKGMYIDYCHYSNKGNEMLADIVFQYIQEGMKGGYRRS